MKEFDTCKPDELSSIEKELKKLKRQMVIVVDDAERENEGDIIMRRN